MEFMPTTPPSDATAHAAMSPPAHTHYTRKLPALVRPIISTARPFAPSSPPAAGRRPEPTASLTNTTCLERLIIYERFMSAFGAMICEQKPFLKPHKL